MGAADSTGARGIHRVSPAAAGVGVARGSRPISGEINTLLAEPTKTDVPHQESLVAAGTIIVGDIVFCGGLRIDGEVKGDVRAVAGQPSSLFIGSKGRVDGTIAVARLVIDGVVTGRISVTEFVKLRSPARVRCDDEYAAIEVHHGAVIEGRLLSRDQAACIERLPAAVQPARTGGDSTRP